MTYSVFKTDEFGDKLLMCECDTREEASKKMDEDFFDNVRRFSSKQNSREHMEIYSCDDNKCNIEYTTKSDGSRHSIGWEIVESK